ncbi:MAG: 4-hydroxy-3-methylbut-2-enyl diphosphate reductase, partial [Planctomycetaceae bacterium]|nr:4-hydroxy-3-methylbut-2-enyl diphosphate reductase [Planctomycetaceae bacterium]
TIYVYHEIVHNSRVVSHYADLGVCFVPSLDDVPECSVLMFSAHGVSPDVRRKAERKSLRIIDATCPLVSQVHRAVQRYAGLGYHVIYIGHPGHDEVVGTVGEAPGQITVISSEHDVQTLVESGLQNHLKLRLACLMQTTLSVTQTRHIVEVLRRHFPNIEIPGVNRSRLKTPDNVARDSVFPKGKRTCKPEISIGDSINICYATQNRQEAVRQLALRSDMALVVGSANSSNSRRLREIAEQQGIPALLIDGAEEIDTQWFSGRETVMITAGASAPEYIVEACVARLKSAFDVTTEEVVTCEEHVVFPLPASLSCRVE